MASRIVARSSAVGAIAALLVVGTAGAATAAPAAPPGGGAVEDVIDLPDGFQPEGIAIDARGTAYFGSLVDGDIYAADLRTGEGEIIAEGPGTPSVGLKVDQFGRLFIAGGNGGDARVIDAATGELLATYQLTEEPAFINDVVLTGDGAWFTNSFTGELYLLPLGPGRALPDEDDIEPLTLTGEWTQVGAFNANGIAETPDHQALLVMQTSTSTVFRVDPVTGEATAIELEGDVALANGDGLLVIGRTLYVVQNRSNLVGVVELDVSGTTGTYVDQLTNPGFDVPTTVAAYGNGLYLPNARFGTLTTPDTTYTAVRIDR